MTNKHDYKAAKHWFSHILEEYMDVFECCDLDKKHAQEINKALTLADRLQNGEVSEDMCKAGNSIMMAEMDDISSAIFKAMTTQLMKEIENDQ